MSNRISRLSGVKRDVCKDINELSSYKEKIINLEESVRDMEYQLSQIKQIINFSKDLSVKSSRDLLNFVSHQCDIYNDKESSEINLKQAIISSNPLTEEHRSIDTHSPSDILCIRLDGRVKSKDNKIKRIHKPDIYMSKEKIERYMAGNGRGANVYWIEDIEEYGVMLNGNLLTGRLCDVIYKSGTNCFDHRLKHGSYSKKCKLSEKRSTCVCGCKFYHSDDMFFLKGSEKYMNIGRQELLSIPLGAVLSKDEFYKLEKRIVHDILVYQILHKFFILKTVQ